MRAYGSAVVTGHDESVHSHARAQRSFDESKISIYILYTFIFICVYAYYEIPKIFVCVYSSIIFFNIHLYSMYKLDIHALFCVFSI